MPGPRQLTSLPTPVPLHGEERPSHCGKEVLDLNYESALLCQQHSD